MDGLVSGEPQDAVASMLLMDVSAISQSSFIFRTTYPIILEIRYVLIIKQKIPAHAPSENFMIISAAIPGMPSKPLIAAVARFIGMCILKDSPMTFNRKRSNAPTTKRIASLPTHFIGWKEAPAAMIIRNTIITPIIKNK
jgi:hypothetical protein